MSSVIESKKLYMYWMRNGTWKSGDRSSDKHQPFNKISESTGLKVPEQMYELLRTCDSLYPNIEVDKNLEPSTITFRTFYGDPFMLLTIFPYKGVPTAWSGSEDTIAADFSTSTDNIDENIAVQIHIHDSSGNNKHIDLFLDGGKITRYSWTLEAGGALIEEFDIKFAEVTVDSTYQVDIDDGFDDGNFNQTGVAEISTVVAKAAADITDGKYFTLSKSDGDGSETKYYCWFDKAGDDSGDPAPSGYTEIKCDISGDTTAQDVSDCIQAAINAVSGLTAANGSGTTTTVTVTNDNTGDITDIVDVDSGLTVAVSTQGKTALDGGWSMWDGEILTSAEKVVLASNCVISVGGSAPTGLRVKSITFEINVPKAMEFVYSSQTAGITWEEGQGPWKCSISGKLSGNQNLSEMNSQLSSKTKSIIKFAYNLGEDKYLQFTNGVLRTIDGLGIAKAGETTDVTYMYEGAGGSDLTFSWTGTEATDPSDHINHTNT